MIEGRRGGAAALLANACGASYYPWMMKLIVTNRSRGEDDSAVE
jgi:hypothetical protein